MFTGNATLKVSIPNCLKCNLLANKQCKNCERPYCSFECSNADREHVCAKNHNNNIGSNGFDNGKSTDRQMQPTKLNKIVRITCVINHRMVFVRPASVKDNEKFAKHINDVVIWSKRMPTLTNMPDIGSFVLAPFAGYYRRAIVLKCVPDTKVLVAFIDFGNIGMTDFNVLKAMPSELKRIEHFARKIALKDINYGLMNNESINYLYKLMAFDEDLTIEFDGMEGEVTLFDGKDENINDNINMYNTFEKERTLKSFYTDESDNGVNYILFYLLKVT